MGDDGTLYLSEIDLSVAPRMITFWLGTTASPRVISGVLDLAPALPGALELVDAYNRPAGLLVVDPVALLAARTWPMSSHQNVFVVGHVPGKDDLAERMKLADLLGSIFARRERRRAAFGGHRCDSKCTEAVMERVYGGPGVNGGGEVRRPTRHR